MLLNASQAPSTCFWQFCFNNFQLLLCQILFWINTTSWRTSRELAMLFLSCSSSLWVQVVMDKKTLMLMQLLQWRKQNKRLCTPQFKALLAIHGMAQIFIQTLVVGLLFRYIYIYSVNYLFTVIAWTVQICFWLKFYNHKFIATWWLQKPPRCLS